MQLSAIAAYLETLLGSERVPDEPRTIYRPSTRSIRRLGLALEPWTEMRRWIDQERLDALFLHRPWQLDTQTLPEELGVLASHRGFDRTLTYGFNLRLATALQMTNVVACAFKDGQPLGMLGEIQPTSYDVQAEMLAEIFGTPPQLTGKDRAIINRIAVVGAMTEAFVHEVATQGAQLYITGQLRRPAIQAVEQSGLSVAALGQAAGEYWGLRALAGLLRERWAQLTVVLVPES